MKWDYSSNPPKAWKVIDGDFVLVDPRDIKLCFVCQKWYLANPINMDSGMCSPGCVLRKNEKSLFIKVDDT